MKISIDERVYEGTGTEIMEQLRLQTFSPGEFPDTASYIRWMRDAYVRATEQEVSLPEGDSAEDVERQAMTMIVRLATAGTLLVLDDGEPGWEPEEEPDEEPEYDGEGDAP